jgi:hypothetical protein
MGKECCFLITSRKNTKRLLQYDTIRNQCDVHFIVLDETHVYALIMNNVTQTDKGILCWTCECKFTKRTSNTKGSEWKCPRKNQTLGLETGETAEHAPAGSVVGLIRSKTWCLKRCLRYKSSIGLRALIFVKTKSINRVFKPERNENE